MMKADEFLEQIEKYETMIKNKEYEIERWRAIAEATTAQMGGERVQTSGSQDKMANAVIELISIIDGKIEIVKSLHKAMEDILSVIESLDVRSYNILHLYYVQHVKVADIASKYDRSESWGNTNLKKAKKKVQAILDERKEEKKNK